MSSATARVIAGGRRSPICDEIASMAQNVGTSTVGTLALPGDREAGR
ncbi:hypothetical protein [Gordonia jinghuaiqii]|uniref:Uncharacterized protein n=1 Tax=Gordonia jinghuaiqii TaxID=2758710 RepID=A0A7D7R5D6_9ACTN|nr:hypothetical protein [Gordonia jinghuaiqii]QMT03587.1 hypothetical protein H1R19_11180 [Gordonia jinghuaiqii]